MRRAFLILLLLGSWPGTAPAQVAVPSLVEEDLPEEEAAPRVEALPPPAPRPAEAPVARPPEPAAARLGKPIQPVRARPEDLSQAWHDRRRALREQDLTLARTAEAKLVELQRELGIENLDDLAVAEARASALALRSGAVADAVGRAELAVRLAPDGYVGHAALARARLARDPTHPGGAFGALRSAIAAVLASPAAARAALGDLLAAGLVAAFAAAALVVGLLALRHARLVVHDARHLPLLRHATPLQAAFVAVVLLAAPLALRLGPAAPLALLVLAVTAYLQTAERLVASIALAAVATLPWAAQRACHLTAWAGTVAADVYEVEHGDPAPATLARLEALSARGELPVPGRLGLGRHHKRRGELDRALRMYEQAGARPEALVGIGNVRLLQGDVDAARASYLAAVDLAVSAGDVSALAAAHYDLSKAFLRQSALEQSQQARRRAALADPALIDRYGTDEDYRANRWLIDVAVPARELRDLAAREAPATLGATVLARLAGPLPGTAWPWAWAGVGVATWLLPLARRRLRPSHACEKCGRAACPRCGAVGTLCGQCVTVYRSPARVDAADRARKHEQVRRHDVNGRRVARALALATGGGGHLWRGEPVTGAAAVLAIAFLVALAASGVGPVALRHPVPWLGPAKQGVAVALGAAAWIVAVRDLFRRTRS